MESDSSDLNASRQNRQRTEDKTRYAMLDFGVLDCPICLESLSIPISCDNGHLACSSCCSKLENKCPSCALPVGHSRCRAMESVLESVLLPCQNAKYGCTETAFGEEPTHENDCTFADYCSCPVQDCNYVGSYIDLYRHYMSIHTTKDFNSQLLFNTFVTDSSFGVKMNISDKILIGREPFEKLLFAVQCFREPNGVYVTVSCIAPSTRKVEQFSYHLTYTVDGQTMTYKSSKMKKIREVSFQTPQNNYMMIPQYLLRGESLEMRLRIDMLNEEQHS